MIQLFKKLEEHFEILRTKTVFRDSLKIPGITYGQLYELSGRIYGYLKDNGIGREDVVVLCLPRGLQIPTAMIGVWRAGAAFVVCEDTYAPERIEFIRNDCGCKLFIDKNNWSEILEHPSLDGREKVDPHDLSYICYTSGTTGNPKGVMHEFGNLDESCLFKSYDGKRIMEQDDILALNAPMNFVAAQDYINNVLWSGASLFVVGYSYIKNPSALIELYEDAEITCTFMTPSAFRILDSMNSRMRWIILGGEPTSNLYRDDIMLYNGYNMSEAGCDLAIFHVTKPHAITPIGKNQGGRKIILLDENGMEVPDGNTGEICFDNPYVRGYRNMPEQTEAVFKNGFFHTGDLAVTDADGNLILQGRSDDMIKINGNRIEPAEIESACKNILKISWACAKGFITEEQAFVVLYYTDDIDVDPAYMRTELSKKLPYYMIPSYYIKIDSIPLLPNGKLNKKELLPPDLKSYRKEYAAPESDMENILCRLFAGVLKLDRIGVDEDFYELGGDSLRSMEVVMSKKIPQLEVSHIYRFRTARAIAAALESEQDLPGADDDLRNKNAMEHDQPLNYFQLYMFDYQLYAPNTTMWNMPRCFRYDRKKVDALKLAKAYETVLSAHPVFRTVLLYNEDYELVQHYDAGRDISVQVEHMTEKEVETLTAQFVKPFRLLDSLLYRARVIETETFVYMFFDSHHIINDGTSMQVLFEDLAFAYEGKELETDMYYLFQRDQYKHTLSEDYADAKQFFETEYGGKEWVQVLSPNMESRKSGIETITVPLGIKKGALKMYLKKSGIGRNAFLQTAALLTMANMEQADNVMLGWVYHGRDSQKKARSVGLLINEIPLGIYLGDITDICSLYETVKKKMNEGLKHRYYPFTMLQSELAVNDILCVIDEGDLLNVEGQGTLVGEEIVLPKDFPAMGWLIALLFINQGEDIFMSLNYTSTRYNRSRMEEFCSTFIKTAETLISSELSDPVPR